MKATIAAMLTAALIAASLPAAAQTPRTWRPASSHGDQTAYIDTGSIERDGDKVRFWREVRSAQPMTLDTGEQLDRLGSLMEVDCRARTLRNIEIYAKLGERLIIGGAGENVVEAILPGSTAETDLRAACLNEWPA